MHDLAREGWLSSRVAAALLGVVLVAGPDPRCAETLAQEPRHEDREGLIDAVPQPGGADADPGEEAPPPTRRQRSARGWRHLGEDGRHLITFPQRRTRKGVLATSAVLGGVSLLILLDDEIRDEVQDARNPTADRWEERIEPFGAGLTTSLASIGVYVGGRLSNSDGAAETGRSMMESLLFTQLFTSVAKGAFGRRGPSGEARASDFFEGDTLFPSGHTSRAFALATVLAERHGKAAAWTAYPMAALVGPSAITF